jgi:DNA-binding CsgD family transcriptional regulator
MRVALYVGDPTLRARIVRACERADIEVAADPACANIVLADGPLDTAAPVIAFVPSSQPGPAGALAATPAQALGWPCDVRAAVPVDIDAATLGAVIAVVAVGLDVIPHRPRNNDVGTSAIRPDAQSIARSGEWAEGDEADDAAAAELNELPALTRREREVLTLLAQGASNKAIARALSVSVHTAKFHVASVTEKLGASGRLEAVAIAIRHGLVMV